MHSWLNPIAERGRFRNESVTEVYLCFRSPICSWLLLLSVNHDTSKFMLAREIGTWISIRKQGSQIQSESRREYFCVLDCIIVSIFVTNERTSRWAGINVSLGRALRHKRGQVNYASFSGDDVSQRTMRNAWTITTEIHVFFDTHLSLNVVWGPLIFSSTSKASLSRLFDNYNFALNEVTFYVSTDPTYKLLQFEQLGLREGDSTMYFLRLTTASPRITKKLFTLNKENKKEASVD